MKKTNNRKYVWRDYDWMRQKYVIEGLSCRAVAAKAGVSRQTIHTWLLRLGIRVRSKKEAMMKYRKGEKVDVSLDEAFDMLAEDRDMADDFLFEMDMMTDEEWLEHWEKKKKEQEEQEKRETEKRLRLQSEEQEKLKEQLKEKHTRLEGTAKEQMNEIQDAFDDTSQYFD